jgi:hypothetical protein
VLAKGLWQVSSSGEVLVGGDPYQSLNMIGRFTLLAASLPLLTDTLQATLILCQRTLSFIFTVPITVGCIIDFIINTVGVVVDEVIIGIVHPRSLPAG